MKIKKWISGILAVVTACAAFSFLGCGGNQGNSSQDELNIIDDNYRNWYEVFVRSYYD